MLAELIYRLASVGKYALQQERDICMPKKCFFLLYILITYSPRTQSGKKKKNKKTPKDVASNTPTQSLSWKHEAPKAWGSSIREGPYLRWAEGEGHEALNACHVRKQLSPVEMTWSVVFYGYYKVLCQWTTLITPAAAVWFEEGGWFWGAPWRMSWASVASDLWNSLDKLCPRQVLCTKRQQPDWLRLPAAYPISSLISY